jgi:hypothetical protein
LTACNLATISGSGTVNAGRKLAVDDVTKVLLGALAGFVAAQIGEYFKRVQSSRVAAIMLVRELAFHRLRLHMALELDQQPGANYELKFPSPVWEAQAAALVQEHQYTR